MGVSAAAARRMIEEGLVRVVGGHPGAKGTRLPASCVVEIASYVLMPAVVLPDAELEVAVIYLDDHLVAIDKPAGVPSHPLKPGEMGTAANAIVARFPECAGASLDPREGGLGHRLDTATSGVLIAARSRNAWITLRRALASEDCEKRYLCEVLGMPEPVGRVDADIGRSGRRGRAVRVGGAGRQPRAAQTSWTVLARGPHTTLLEARLHAGRAHQVRAHLSSAGFPIVGDDRYGGMSQDSGGGSSGDTGEGPPRLHLHAAAVHFTYPLTVAAAPLVITAPHPPWVRRLLDVSNVVG